MQEELEKLKAPSSSSKNPYETPPPKVPAPSPGPKAKVLPPPELKPPETEGARLNRLRRLCEKKPSGKCNVPEAIHLRWKNSTRDEKEAMIEELEKSGWSEDNQG